MVEVEGELNDVGALKLQVPTDHAMVFFSSPPFLGVRGEVLSQPFVTFCGWQCLVLLFEEPST
jgi:hypothetical protein